MKGVAPLTAAVGLLVVCAAAQADVFNMGPGLTSLETVTVGDPGNAADTRYASPGYGSVGYTYNIGKYEVTAAQYTDFLNHKAKSDPYGLYNSNMADLNWYVCKIQRGGSSGSYTYSVASDYANRPVNYVSFWDSLRFANWLNNGQGDGDTETGAYTLDGYNGGDGRTIQRNAGAKWAVTSEEEWYKAAYYKGGGTNAGYWDYPTQSDTAPSNVLGDPTDPGNTATYYNPDTPRGYTIGNPYFRTEVGAHENSGSAYGTFDQAGNVWEWNESTAYDYYDGYSYRNLRGGWFGGGTDGYLRAADRTDYVLTYEVESVGFRVAAVPEPSSVIAFLCGLGGLVWRRGRPAC